MTGSQTTALEDRVAAVEAIYETYLSWVGVTVGVLTLAVVLFGLASFAYFRYVAKYAARQTAREEATSVAERMANAYLQEHLPAMVRTYQDLARQASEDEGDTIAQSPD